MERTKFGARMKPSLPVTIDSLLAADRDGMKNEEVLPGRWYIAKPRGAHGPLWKRAYHAWLVLTNRAMAVQFTSDHVALVNNPEAHLHARPSASQ